MQGTGEIRSLRVVSDSLPPRLEHTHTHVYYTYVWIYVFVNNTLQIPGYPVQKSPPQVSPGVSHVLSAEAERSPHTGRFSPKKKEALRWLRGQQSSIGGLLHEAQ